MYRYTRPKPTKLEVNTSKEGETIEAKLRRMLAGGEPLTEGAEIAYQDRNEGVDPDCDIRTDRWEHAIDAKDKAAKSHLAKREIALGERTWDTMSEDQQKAFSEKYPNANVPKGTNAGGESTHGTK